MTTCKPRSGFLEGEQKKQGSDVQVEISFEGEERVAHVLREDGDRQQVSSEVIRTVAKGTQHGWSRLVGSVGSDVQEEACAGSEAAEGESKGR